MRFWLCLIAVEIIWTMISSVGIMYGIDVFIQHEYATGQRTTTDGDSVFLAFVYAVMINIKLLLILNLIVAVWRFTGRVPPRLDPHRDRTRFCSRRVC